MTLDSELQAKYFASLASGEALLMHITQWSHNQLFLFPSGAGDYNIVLARPSVVITVLVDHAPELNETEKKTGVNYGNFFWGSDHVGNNN